MFDLEVDRTERRDLAGAVPAKVEELAERWQSWADRAGVLSWPVEPPEDSAGTQ